MPGLNTTTFFLLHSHDIKALDSSLLPFLFLSLSIPSLLFSSLPFSSLLFPSFPFPSLLYLSLTCPSIPPFPVGEGVDDHGGPYRAALHTAVGEEPSEFLDLLSPCMNAESDTGEVEKRR